MLYAYANFDPEIGYTQGMNFIVYILIKYVGEEEYVFWWLYDIMYYKNWRLILKNETPKFKDLVRGWRMKILEADKKLYKRLAKCEVPFLGIFSSYYMSLFVDIWPIEVACRIFDVFLFEGEKIITKIIVRLFVHNKKKIMEIDRDDLFQFLNEDLLSSFLKDKSIDQLFS